jgi:undecaprenyl diphosphate synthase
MAGAQSIGIIIDGNRRWARALGRPPWDGHTEGIARVADTIQWAKERGGITDVFFYTLSTENWNRDTKEIEYLLLLFRKFFLTHVDRIHEENIRIRVAGQRERFPLVLQRIMSDAEEKTKMNTALTVWFGLSYGGRAEILDAVNKAIQLGGQVTDESLRSLMWTAQLPDPDIIVRTGGEQRLSGFLTWQSIYSELFFTKTPWPGFSKEEFYSILDEYDTRQRRMGK